MDSTSLVLALIKAYNDAHNRLRRARRRFHRVHTQGYEKVDGKKTNWYDSMKVLGLRSHYMPPDKTNRQEWHRSNFFRDSGAFEVANVFTTHAKKHAVIKSIKQSIAMQADIMGRTSMEARLSEIEKRPVETKLAKIWQEIVDSACEITNAYNARWEVRSAIKVFNKLNPKLQIKFGNCRPGGGSMSAINHVLIDGDKVKLSNFLDNALFETAVLNS